MILNLEKLSKLERRYSHDKITLSALHNMVNVVTTSPVNAAELSVTSQFLTLADLGVIKGIEGSEKEVKQLNS